MPFSSWFLKLHYMFQMPAVSQAKSEHINIQEMAVRKHQEQQIAALKSEVERTQSLQRETLLQLPHVEAKIDRSDKQCLTQKDIRRCLTNKLNRWVQTFCLFVHFCFNLKLYSVSLFTAIPSNIPVLDPVRMLDAQQFMHASVVFPELIICWQMSVLKGLKSTCQATPQLQDQLWETPWKQEKTYWAQVSSFTFHSSTAKSFRDGIIGWLQAPEFPSQALKRPDGQTWKLLLCVCPYHPLFPFSWLHVSPDLCTLLSHYRVFHWFLTLALLSN